MNLLRPAVFVAFLCILLIGVDASYAQRQPVEQAGGAGNAQPISPASSGLPIYKVFRTGEVTIDVNLWGYVGSPGHYTIPGSTPLVELLSYAGGPTSQARLVDIRIVHADTASEKRVESFNLEAYRDNGDLSQNPLLVPGDTIIVSGRALDVFFQAIGIITNIMVIITALINFISFTTK
jgi:hypothetical protein